VRARSPTCKRGLPRATRRGISATVAPPDRASPKRKRGTEARGRASELGRLEHLVDFAALVGAIEDYAIFMLSPEGRVVSWNPGAQRIKQYAADEIIGRHFSVFYPPEEVSAGVCDRMLETATREGRVETEGWRVRKDDSRFWAMVTLTAIRGHDGSLLGFAKVTRDLTARKQADEERIRLAQAQEAIRLRDEFLVIAAHELRTPLTALGLQLQRLQRSSAPQEIVQTAMRSSRRLVALVETLLDVSRIATGHMKLDRLECDLAQLTREVAERWTEEASRAGCEIRIEAPGPVRGRWDALRMEQVIENLLGNAMKYAPGKPVRIAVSAHEGVAELTVADEGPGVAPGAERRIFDRFERAVDSRHYGGMGLGLFIAREIVEAHGGSIAVDSAPGTGATFRVHLPMHP
jgi:PAS domain S-box-containing protein